MDRPSLKKSHEDLCKVTAHFASVRIARADQFAAVLARIDVYGTARTFEALSRACGIPSKRIRALRDGERPKPGEMEMLGAMADQIENGQGLREAGRRAVALLAERSRT